MSLSSKFTDPFAGELAPTSVPRFAREDTAIVLTLHVKGTMEGKLKLSALDADDLGVISAAIQDSLVAVRDCAYFAGEKRFVLLLNRFQHLASHLKDSSVLRVPTGSRDSPF